MAINAARPRAMTDGSQTGIVDTSVTVPASPSDIAVNNARYLVPGAV